jgi:hypothetical protein
LAFKSSRPTYAIILLVLSSLFMCATFLPLLYSIVLPNQDIQGFVSALEQRSTPSMEAESVVQQAIAAAGPLTRAIPIAYNSEWTVAIHYAGSQPSEKLRASQAIYIAWFQRHPKAALVAFTCYENGAGQKAYQIREVDPVGMVRGYAIPLGLFGLSLFLVRRKKPPADLPWTACRFRAWTIDVLLAGESILRQLHLSRPTHLCRD